MVLVEVEPVLRRSSRSKEAHARGKRGLICGEMEQEIVVWGIICGGGWREGREKQSQLKKASVERGYLPENETESSFRFSCLLCTPRPRPTLGLKGCRSHEGEEKGKRADMIMVRVLGCQRFTLLACSSAKKYKYGFNMKSTGCQQFLPMT